MITKLIAALNTVNRAVGKNITYNGTRVGDSFIYELTDEQYE